MLVWLGIAALLALLLCQLVVLARMVRQGRDMDRYLRTGDLARLERDMERW